MIKCQFCERELKTKAALVTHEPYCKINPNRVQRIKSPNAHAIKGCTTWNKGLTKNDSISILNGSLKISNSLKIKPPTGIGKTNEIELERRRKISLKLKDHPNGGGLREGSGRGIKTWYESPIAGKVYLRSTYELAYVKYLDENKINWKQNLQSFNYIYEDKKRNYYPDFYLIDEDCYIEVKGFKTKQDEAKWKYFPYKLKILFGNDIQLLEKRKMPGMDEDTDLKSAEC